MEPCFQDFNKNNFIHNVNWNHSNFIIILMMIKRKTKNILYRPMIVFLFYLVFNIILHFLLKINQSNYGLITTKKCPFIPAHQKHKSFILRTSRSGVQNFRFSSEWYQIQFSNGLKGWIKGIDLELI